MPPKPPHAQGLCLLLLVTVACPWLSCTGMGYDEFLQRHVDYPKSSFGDDNAYCEEMMPSRGMGCWRGNTFLHASIGELQSLCRSRGHLVAVPERSLSLFPITVCSRRGKKSPESCRYEGGSITAEIWLTCLKGLPVHFIKYG